MGEWFTPEEVQKKFKLKTVETVYEWIHKGDARGRKLGCKRVGRHFRISEMHLEDFLA